jgi:sugar phosphate isomerase/epimerase
MTTVLTDHSAGRSAGLESAGFAVGYGTNGFADHRLDDALDVLASQGYAAVALTLGHPHFDVFAPDVTSRAGRLHQALEDRGLRVVVETGARYTLDPFRKHHPTLLHADPGRRVDFLRRAVDVAAILRAECVSLWSGVLPAGEDPRHAGDRLRDRMAELLDYARAQGVTLAFEPEPGMLIETVADALRLRSDLGDPAQLGITVDLGHCLVVEPGGVVGALREAGALLRNVQLDDMRSTAHEHLEFGDGELDLAEALRALDDLGYRGVAAIELPRHSHDAPAVSARCMTALRNAWET